MIVDMIPTLRIQPLEYNVACIEPISRSSRDSVTDEDVERCSMESQRAVSSFQVGNRLRLRSDRLPTLPYLSSLSSYLSNLEKHLRQVVPLYPAEPAKSSGVFFERILKCSLFYDTT